MTSLDGARHTRVFVNWGTVLYVDPTSRRLRNGAADGVPANIVFVAHGAQAGPGQCGSLVYVEAGTPWRLRREADGELAVSDDVWRPELEPELTIVHLERGLVGIMGGGLFLRAIPNGQVELAAERCSWWEFFLLADDWRPEGEDRDAVLAGLNIDRPWLQSHIVDTVVRARVVTGSPARKKVLIYGYPQWSHGRVYYDLCKYLYDRGFLLDILDGREDHAEYFGELLTFYDFVLSALDGIVTLVDAYHVPYDRIIGVSHNETGVQVLIEQKGKDVFDELAAYGVVSDFVYCRSMMMGVSRVPRVVPLGVDYKAFYSEISDRLSVVGYASSMSLECDGVDVKRGHLAKEAAERAGLEFKVAGSTGSQISFHDMPAFYRDVDAVVTSSISEAAGLPSMEAAAAGRLVIGTAVGDFPARAALGGGILAPVEADSFVAFVSETLRYYRDNPSAYREACRAVQQVAEAFDWRHTIDAWAHLIEGTIAPRVVDRNSAVTLASPRAASRGAVQLPPRAFGPVEDYHIRSRLFTTHHSVIFFDWNERVLRHGQLGVVPANVMIEVSNKGCELFVLGDEQEMKLTFGIEGFKIDDPKASTCGRMELHHVGGQWHGLRCGDLFLTALPNGNCEASRQVCDGWESFVLAEEPPDWRRLGRTYAHKPRPSLGISCIETRPDRILRAAEAVRRTASCVLADVVYWFSTNAFPFRLPRLDVVHVPIQHFTDYIEDANRIGLRLVPNICETDFNLTVQDHAFAVNPQAWDDVFFDYDYIGAPFCRLWGGGPYWAGPIVGNGGFSLRSRKLHEALKSWPIDWYVEDWLQHEPRLRNFGYSVRNRSGRACIQEDILISVMARRVFEERYDIRFCPAELAARFSLFEATEFTQHWVGRSFGFHGEDIAVHYCIDLSTN